MDTDIEEMMKTIVIKFQEPDDRKFFPDVNKSWIHLRRELENDKKLLSLVIKDYIDNMEWIMKKYSKKLTSLFTKYLKKRTLKVDPDSGDIPEWDELVVNNIKIKMIHVGEMHIGAFEDVKDIEGFPFKTYKQSSDISKYVKNVVKREKREK